MPARRPRVLGEGAVELRKDPAGWPKWLQDAQTENAEAEIVNGRLVWWGGTFHDGVWVDGDWLGGSWRDGIWCAGAFMSGIWYAGDWRDGYFGKAIWHDGVFRGGKFHGWWRGGLWLAGEWYGVGER